MKGWLLDENIPQNVTFTATLPVIHARCLGASVSDTTIWQHARSNPLAIVSKDADFSYIETLLPEHKLVNVYADRIESVKG